MGIPLSKVRPHVRDVTQVIIRAIRNLHNVQLKLKLIPIKEELSPIQLPIINERLPLIFQHCQRNLLEYLQELPHQME